MKYLALLSCVIIFTFTTQAQLKLRTVEELINKEEPAWPFVQEWISSATNKVEVLPCTPEKGSTALYKTQVTTRSPMGAIIYGTGGIFIDHGWIRILGAGCPRMDRSLPDHNIAYGLITDGQAPSYLLIADDVLGGRFALNGGGLGKDLGKVYYYAPDTHQYEPLELTYTDFLNFCFNGDLNDFYKNFRWKDWQKDVSQLNGNQVYTFYPFLGTKEAEDINSVSRKAIPIYQ